MTARLGLQGTVFLVIIGFHQKIRVTHDHAPDVVQMPLEDLELCFVHLLELAEVSGDI